MKTLQHAVHTFTPIYDSSSSVLILGSFPSVKSRENGFYYGHPQNRFWKVIAGVIGCETPCTITDKKELLLKNHIALWDVVSECDIQGSSDADINNVVPTDINLILNECNIRAIIANGKAAEKIYNTYQYPVCRREIIYLPSTSAANAAWSVQRLIDSWQSIMEYLK